MVSPIEVIARFSWANLLEEEIVKYNVLIFGTSFGCQVYPEPEPEVEFSSHSFD